MTSSFRLLWIGGAAAALCGMAFAQQSTMDLGNGTVVRANAAEGSTVRVNGQIINSASGPGAVAETNIGSRSVQTRSRGNNTSTVTIEGKDGSSVTSVTTITNRSGGSHAVGSSAGVGGGSQDFVNANLSGRNFARANFAGRSFTNVDLTHANLQGADLRNAHMVNVDLTGADLSGANLSGASFVNTNIEDARTQGALWSGSKR